MHVMYFTNNTLHTHTGYTRLDTAINSSTGLYKAKRSYAEVYAAIQSYPQLYKARQS